MSKIFKRESLQIKGRKLKVDKNRKRNVIVNFRMLPEEKGLLEKNSIIRIKKTRLYDSNKLKSQS